MGRWEPNAQGRLQQAAFELFQERGYAATTVQEIAARAGLTERTFFRYFADKREVLFAGAEALGDGIARSMADAAPTKGPLEVVEQALVDAGPMFEPRREGARLRRALILSDAELRERELIKMTALVKRMAASLGARGVAELPALLAAETAGAIFRVCFDRWLDDADLRPFGTHVRGAFAELRSMSRGGA